ncbi:tRNA-modifying protein YgfZ [Orbaceae bacterium ac157xtp]
MRSIMHNLIPNNTTNYCELTQWQLVKVYGADAEKFLQGQLTADINELTDNHFIFAAHCDAKGKVWSNLLLFKNGDVIYYLLRKSVADIQVQKLKMYAVFSKVTIDLDNTSQVLGTTASILEEEFTTNNVNCITRSGVSYLKLNQPFNRYLIIGAKNDIQSLSIFNNLTKVDDSFWQLLDMQSSYPIIDAPNANQFLPQALNLQDMDAISFTKGCYCGQEMVARAQYRGINKRALFLLTGISKAAPIIGDNLEQKIDENWREIGTILSFIKQKNDQIFIQVVLSSDIEQNALFRIKNDLESELTISNKH